MTIEEKIIIRYLDYTSNNSPPSKSFQGKVRNYLKGKNVTLSQVKHPYTKEVN